MAWYILRTTLGGPEQYIEYTYEEQVVVQKNIVITENVNTATQLCCSANFSILSKVETKEEADVYVEDYHRAEAIEALPVEVPLGLPEEIVVPKPAVGLGPQNKLEKMMQESEDGSVPNVPWWSGGSRVASNTA